MITSYEAGSANFHRYLEEVARDAQYEETASGLGYMVSDLLPLESTVIGTVTETSDSVAVDLILSAEAPADIRQDIAEICFRSQEWTGQYRVAIAADKLLEGKNEAELNPALFDIINVNLQSHRRWIQDMDRRGDYPHPFTRSQLLATMGWVAVRKPWNEHGQEAIDSLEKAGLFIPLSKDGALQTTASNGMTVEIMAMPERSERHRCKCCSGQIPKGINRVTISQDRTVNGYDHHHFHPSCFFENEVSKLNLKTALILPPKS